MAPPITFLPSLGTHLAAFYVVGGLLAGLLCFYCFRKKAGPNLPPGPKPLPIVGNLWDLPPKGIPEYQHWLKFKDAYGPISSVTVFNQSMIILHDSEAAHDLMDKHAIKTSGRPRMHFAGDLCGFDVFLSLLSYTKRFREQRKLVHQQLGTRTSAARFRDVVDAESCRLLLKAMNDPTKSMEYIKDEAGAIILRITYGYEIETNIPDPLVLLVDRTMQNASRALMPLAWIVDAVPALKYLPEWFPAASFKKTARQYKKLVEVTVQAPYEFVRRQMALGNHRPSFVSSLVEEIGQSDTKEKTPSQDYESAVKNAAVIMYAAGADTTVSTVRSLVLAMTLFPAVKKKAQDEIDRVVGVGKLPQFDDREKLPYVNAVVKEALRWLPVTPTGLAHSASEEFIFRGYRIPKGACIVPSVWWFLHDPKTYPDPSSFEPARFLEPRNEPDPASEAFGYGRRICPGRFLADDSLFLTISRILAVFDINKAIDAEGNEIEPKVGQVAGVIARPVDFTYNIKPRSAMHADLIRTIEVTHPLGKGDASNLQHDFSELLARE